MLLIGVAGGDGGVEDAALGAPRRPSWSSCRGGNLVALWRDGSFAWKRLDVGLGGLRATGRGGGHVPLRAQVDWSGDGDLTVRIAGGTVGVVAGGR